MNDNQEITPAKVALNFGLISGGIGIIYTLMLYIMGTDKLASSLWSSISFIIYIFFMVYAGLNYRKQTGGFLSFRNGLLISFTTFAVTLFLLFSFTYVLYNVIHPGLSDEIKTKIIENAVETMQYFGAPDEIIDTQIEQLEKQDFSQTLGNLIQSYFSFCIFGFIISLIIAAFIKKKQPPFAENNTQE